MKTVLAVTVLVTSVCTLPLAAEEKHEHRTHTPMAAALAEKSDAEFEATFLALMIHHHKAGEPMWVMAREKSKNDTILELEKKTVAKGKEEIEKMTGWLKEWHQKTPQDFKEPEESRQIMEKDMAALKATSGTGFDRAFAEKMAHHHMDAIEMAKLAKSKVQHSEVKDFAKELAEAQGKDRQRLLEVAGKKSSPRKK